MRQPLFLEKGRTQINNCYDGYNQGGIISLIVFTKILHGKICGQVVADLRERYILQCRSRKRAAFLRKGDL